jgi:hypothetical protein
MSSPGEYVFAIVEHSEKAKNKHVAEISLSFPGS